MARKSVKWVEIIKIRLTDADRPMLENEIMKSIADFRNRDGIREVKLYQHASDKNDLSLHLYWKSRNMESQGSPIGLSMVHILKEYGLIHHSVWREKE